MFIHGSKLKSYEQDELITGFSTASNYISVTNTIWNALYTDLEDVWINSVYGELVPVEGVYYGLGRAVWINELPSSNVDYSLMIASLYGIRSVQVCFITTVLARN